MRIETLEARCLMSAAVVDGVLTVTGDDADNLMQVQFSPGATDAADDDTLVLTERTTPATPPGTGAPDPNLFTPRQRRRADRLLRRAARDAARAAVAVEPTVTEFNIAQLGITSILVNAGAGNDIVKILAHVKLPATINGGAGDDRIRVGGASSTVNGGDGDDTILGGSEPDTLNGDAGNDRINAQHGGIDTVNGGSEGSSPALGDMALIDSSVPPPGRLPGGETCECTSTEDDDIVTGIEATAIPYGGFWASHPKDPLSASTVTTRFTQEQAAALKAGASFGSVVRGPYADIYQHP